MTTTTETTYCECGDPATTAIWNGMYMLKICQPCADDPETIATVVLVEAAEDGDLGDEHIAELLNRDNHTAWLGFVLARRDVWY